MSRRQCFGFLAGCGLILALEAPRLFVSLQSAFEGAYPAWEVEGRRAAALMLPSEDSPPGAKVMPLLSLADS